MAQDALNSLILSSAPVSHGSEVVWSIWAARLFDLTLSSASWKAITQMDDSFVAVAAFAANPVGELIGELDSNLWAGWLEEGCFEQNHWLFAYEAYRNGWMDNEVTQAKLGSVPACEFMKTSGVAFVDEQAIKDYKPARMCIGGGGGGGY